MAAGAQGRPPLRRRLFAAAVAVAVVGTPIAAVAGCSRGATAATATTTVPEPLWLGQSRVWLAAHSSTLGDISAAAKMLGDAAKAGNNDLAQIAASEMLIKVGLADGTLPDNSFGHDLHHVFVEYAEALAMIRKGILKNDQGTFKAGADALARAVADFGTITKRMNATP